MGTVEQQAVWVAQLRKDMAARGVGYVFAQFTDIHGAAKGKLIPLAHLADIVDPGAGFSGPWARNSSVNSWR